MIKLEPRLNGAEHLFLLHDAPVWTVAHIAYGKYTGSWCSIWPSTIGVYVVRGICMVYVMCNTGVLAIPLWVCIWFLAMYMHGTAHCI